MGRASPTIAAAALALGFFALHLPYPAPSLEDIDSINFALGIRAFDVAEHQPHPPGYPVFMLVAKIANLITRSEVRALGGLGMLSGALAAFVLVALFRRIDPDPRRVWSGLLGTLLVLASPLMWVTAARPLSDVPGLVAALGVQWLILGASTPRQLTAAAAAAGLAAGIRSQVVWLTLPLIALAILRNRQARQPAALLSIVAGYGGGALLWAVPLLALSGGPRGYWQAIAFQGAADLSGVTMLWTTPTLRQLLAEIEYAFIAPWGWWPLAAAVLAAAALGVWRLWWSSRELLIVMAVGFGPYLVFNALFQETVTTRYALPLAVPVAAFAVTGVVQTAPRVGPWLMVGLAAVAVSIGQASLAAYASQPAPAFRLLADMRASTRPDAGNRVLALHRREEFDLRRPLRWLEPDAPRFAAQLPAPPRLEWLELVNYWNNGGRNPVWFVADPLRSDLALVHHEPAKASYRWPLRFRQLIGGVRPNEMDWYELRAPAWYLGEGWSLTPEAAGVAAAAHRGPGVGGSSGWIRRHDGPATIMIGGRLLPGGPATAQILMSIDGRPVQEFEVGPGFFLRMVDLPAGALAGSGDYATMTISADSDRVALEQFDAQPAGTVIYGFAEGWHEHEYNPATGEQWRWTSDRSTLRIRTAGKALLLRIRGESEVAGNVRLTVRANDQVVASEAVGSTFLLNVPLRGSIVDRGEILATIETDGSFIPAERRWRSQDRRRLGLKILECRVIPAS